MSPTYTVYKHTNTATNKSYVGMTKNMKIRLSRHKDVRSTCVRFRNSILKHGWDVFTTEIIAEGLTREAAQELERTTIADHNTMHPNGYNLTSGGDHHEVSDETRAKLVASHTGKHHTDATKAKIRAAMLKRPPQPERGAAISAAKRGYVIPQTQRTCQHCAWVGPGNVLPRHNRSNPELDCYRGASS